MILGFSYWLHLKFKEKILLAEPVYFSDGILREFLKQIHCKDQTKKAEKYQTLAKYNLCKFHSFLVITLQTASEFFKNSGHRKKR